MVKVLKPKGNVKKVQKKEVREEPQKEASVDSWAESLRVLSKFYLGEMDLTMKMKQMSIVKGKEFPDWMAALELLKDLIIKTDHPDMKLNMYKGMVDLLAKMGQKEELLTIQEIIARFTLKSFKDMGFEKVEVECAEDACPACRKMAGKRFKIDEAMESMPLPCRECTTDIDAIQGYCRCRYFAVF